MKRVNALRPNQREALAKTMAAYLTCAIAARRVVDHPRSNRAFKALADAVKAWTKAERDMLHTFYGIEP